MSEESEKKVVGIRGLDTELYLKIQTKAKEEDRNVGELINEIFYNYLSGEKDQVNSIVGLGRLELSEEELQALAPAKFVKIQELILKPDVTIKTLTSSVKEFNRITKILTPKVLYPYILKLVRYCGVVEKYSGDFVPRIVRREFRSNTDISYDFIRYFLDTDTKIKLRIRANAKIAEGITSEQLDAVIHSLRVDGNIYAPEPVIGWIYAKADVRGQIISEK